MVTEQDAYPEGQAKGPPVLIAGCGRSGTSFLRTAVDAHPDVFIPSESLFFTDYLAYGRRPPAWLSRWLFFHEPQLRCWYNGPVFDFTDPAVAMAEVHRRMAAAAGASRWGQKTPRFIRSMALLEAALGEVKWILVYRDPRAVAASMKRSGQHTYSVERACRRWLRDNAPILAYQQGAPQPDNVLVIAYETLVRDFEATMARVFDFIGVPPLDRQTIERRARPVFFARSRFAMNTVRDGVLPDADKLAAWRQVLAPWEVAHVEHRCGQAMASLGYPLHTARPRPGGWRLLGPSLQDITIVGRYLRYWPEYLFMTGLRTVMLRAWPRIR